MINRIKPAGWAINEKLTSAQQNGVDINTTYALDKRSGQSDTLSSTIDVASGALIRANSGAEINFDSGSLLSTDLGSTANFDGYVNLNHINHVTSGASFAVDAGATLSIIGTTTVNNFFTMQSLSTLKLQGGLWFDTTTLSSSGTHSIDLNTKTLTLNNGTLSAPAGATILVAGTLTCSGTSTVNVANNLTLSSGSSNVVFSSPRTYTKTISSPPIADFTANYLVGSNARISTVSTSAVDLVWGIKVPNGCTITGFSVWILPNGVHANLPSTMPRAKLVTTLTSANTITSIGDTADGSANVAAYETVHAITASGLSVTVNNFTTRYNLVFTSETGSNVISGAYIIGATVTYSSSGLDSAQ